MPFGDIKRSQLKYTDQAETTRITQIDQTNYSKTLYQMRQSRMEKTQRLSKHFVEQAKKFENLHPWDQHLQEQKVSKHLVDLQAIITDAKVCLPHSHDMRELAQTMAKEILEAYPSLNRFVHQGYTADLANIADEKVIASPFLSQDRPAQYDSVSAPFPSNEEIRGEASSSRILIRERQQQAEVSQQETSGEKDQLLGDLEKIYRSNNKYNANISFAALTLRGYYKTKFNNRSYFESNRSYWDENRKKALEKINSINTSSNPIKKDLARLKEIDQKLEKIK